MANQESNSTEHIWIPQYYGKIKGEKKLLYSRSFSQSQLRFVDIDHDGDNDLFIGKSDGRIAFFINQGNSSKPVFKLEAEDFSVIHERIDEFGNSILQENILDIGKNAAPDFVDIDNDEDHDLFVGSSDGYIFHYENRGNRLKPKFFRKTPIYMGLRFGKNSIPRFADLNGDKNIDLLVGTGSGEIKIFFNSGIKGEAIFCPEFDVNDPPDIRCKYQPEKIASIAPLTDAVPEIIDWDQDKDLDLVVGKSNGKINFYLNIGNQFSPKWTLKSKRFQFIDGGGKVFPTFHDLDRDGYSELFLGTTSSNIIFYKNREVLLNKLSKIKKINLQKINTSSSIKKTLSSACDQLNGLPDCLITLSLAFDVPDEEKIEKLDQLITYVLKTDISIFPNSNNIPQSKSNSEDLSKNEEKISKKFLSRNQLWLTSSNFLNIENLGGNLLFSSITSGDWNYDGKLDILIGSKSGEIFAFENRSDNGTDWYPLYSPVLERNNRRYSTPFLIDIDADKDLDIICGNKKGKIEWIINRGTQKKPDWRIYDLNLSKIDVGSFSSPLLEDMDGDEDLDMLVGNSKGLIIYYENKGNKNIPHFVLRNTRMAGLKMEANSTPSFWNWNRDQHPDLVIGNREGTLSLISHLPPESSPVFRGWNLINDKWQNIKSVGNSSPHFADFDGDNKTDFMMGDNQGNLIFWKNGGLKKIAKLKNDKNLILSKNSLEIDESIKDKPEEILDIEIPLKNEDKLDNEPFKPKFELVSKKFGDLELGRRSFPAFLDIDGDENIDLIVGNKAGELRYYKQDKILGDTNWSLETSHFLDYKGGKNSAPVFTDIDGDNDLDLLVGNQKGSILFWENKGNFEIAEFVFNPTPFLGVTGGRNSVPAALDLNSDGLRDILIGNLLGQIYKYNREKDRFRFRLDMRKYLNLDVGLGAVPRLVDINKDKQPELIVGSDSGKIISFKKYNEKSEEIKWIPTDEYFKDLKFPIGGNPVFVDLDKDGDLDLILGNEEGTLHYYRNTGY